MKKHQPQNDNFLITLLKRDGYSTAVRVLCVADKEVGCNEKNSGGSLLDGKKRPRNVYAHSEEECEKLLAEMIVEMKTEIAAERERLKAG